jgi:hypothetical protein
VSKPGKPSGLCSAGLLDVCAAVCCCVLLCTAVYCSEDVARQSDHILWAAHSSTQQYTAAHSSIQHYTAVHSSTQQYTAVHSSTQQYTSVHSSTQQHTAVHNSTQQYTTVHTSTHIQQPSATQPRRLSRFAHQKAELTIVLLMMGILVPETCWVNKPAFCRI